MASLSSESIAARTRLPGRQVTWHEKERITKRMSG